MLIFVPLNQRILHKITFGRGQELGLPSERFYRASLIFAAGLATMKWIAEYIEHAIRFEHLAAIERNPEVRAKLEEQAVAYRKAAEDRAKQIGVPPPGQQP